jgi:hypothetical protein
MKREVVLSEPALADLLDINDYYLREVSDRVACSIAKNSSLRRADSCSACSGHLISQKHPSLKVT